MNAVYTHPDGFTLAFNDHTLIATDSDDKTVYLPIGPLGLVELGNALLVLAAAQEEKFTSEQAGAGMGNDLINELLAVRGKPQAEAFRAIQDKLHTLSKLEDFESAAGGFAGAVVNVLQLGVANIPQHEECEE